jgi:hypothetical protein
LEKSSKTKYFNKNILILSSDKLNLEKFGRAWKSLDNQPRNMENNSFTGYPFTATPPRLYQGQAVILVTFYQNSTALFFLNHLTHKRFRVLQEVVLLRQLSQETPITYFCDNNLYVKIHINKLTSHRFCCLNVEVLFGWVAFTNLV